MKYTGIDQYGNTYHGLTHPQKDLMKRIGIQQVIKMYQDDRNGKAVHTGYVIGNHWITIYNVTPWRSE